MNASPKVRDLFLSTERGELGTRLRLPAVPIGLAHLWKNHSEVRAQLRVTAADPSRTVFVHIRHHILDSTHHPSIEVRGAGAPLSHERASLVTSRCTQRFSGS